MRRLDLLMNEWYTFFSYGMIAICSWHCMWVGVGRVALRGMRRDEI